MTREVLQPGFTDAPASVNTHSYDATIEEAWALFLAGSYTWEMYVRDVLFARKRYGVGELASDSGDIQSPHRPRRKMSAGSGNRLGVSRRAKLELLRSEGDE